MIRMLPFDERKENKKDLTDALWDETSSCVGTDSGWGRLLFLMLLLWLTREEFWCILESSVVVRGVLWLEDIVIFLQKW